MSHCLRIYIEALMKFHIAVLMMMMMIRLERKLHFMVVYTVREKVYIEFDDTVKV